MKLFSPTCPRNAFNKRIAPIRGPCDFSSSFLGLRLLERDHYLALMRLGGVDGADKALSACFVGTPTPYVALRTRSICQVLRLCRLSSTPYGNSSSFARPQVPSQEDALDGWRSVTPPPLVASNPLLAPYAPPAPQRHCSVSEFAHDPPVVLGQHSLAPSCSIRRDVSPWYKGIHELARSKLADISLPIGLIGGFTPAVLPCSFWSVKLCSICLDSNN
ncbi:hypothetical protein MUK42_07727 [Musa troglodytarum]|uniref:Uncharacterized protein n=1 Tax=Musa troglodytarum TaxID=320322 RepID=A0A9E7HNW7_9LILI|nr:hypothetical protein MUK42_07727 [Musa troglodytarum]